VANSTSDIQTQRGYYLDRMVVVDQALSLWYLHRLRVPPEVGDVFYRLVEISAFGGRIDLFTSLAASDAEKAVGHQLEIAHAFGNTLAHGQVSSAADEVGGVPREDAWVIAASGRTGRTEFSVTAGEIEARRRGLTSLLNELRRLTLRMPSP
jgi:hypothetical protein